MATYTAPLRDMRFVLHELLDAGSLAQLPGYEQATPDLIDAVLEAAASKPLFGVCVGMQMLLDCS